MDFYIAQPSTNEQAKALRAFMEALEIDFAVSKPNGEENWLMVDKSRQRTSLEYEVPEDKEQILAVFCKKMVFT